jgi:putative transposase
MINQNQIQNKLVCKYCQSEAVIKYGIQDGLQYYYCKACHRKFSRSDTIPAMHNKTKDIADALNMYYEGMSLNEIRRNFIQQDENYISKVSAYNWVNRFTELAEKEADKYQPKVGDTWIADETFIRVDKRKPKDAKVENPYTRSRSAKWVVFWDIIDADTRFLLASHVTTTRNTQDAKLLMEKAAKRAGKLPKVVVTDKLGSYLTGIEAAFGADTQHRQGEPFKVENNTNLIERFHGTLKDRTKVMRALKNRDTLQKFTDGWLVHYNYFRPHMSLNDKTPAQAAGINFPFRNWKDVVEQPYEKTARIQIKEGKPRKLVLVKQPRVTRIKPQIRHVQNLGMGIVRERGKQHISISPKWIKPHKARRGNGITRRSDR